MSIDPQHMEQDKRLREDKEIRFIKQLLHHAVEMLEDDERMGEPYRDGNRIIIPIMNPEEHGGRHDVNPISLHALMDAWLENA